MVREFEFFTDIQNMLIENQESKQQTDNSIAKVSQSDLNKYKSGLKDHGKKSEYYKDVSRYIGEWKDGKQNGHGNHIYSD